jgi:hypothetical protein
VVRALGAGLLVVAATACAKKTNDEDAATRARIAAMRAHSDSVRHARQVADSLQLVRFTACSDSVKGALAKTKAGRKKLAAKLPEGATLPEIASACAPAGTTAVLAASTAPSTAPSAGSSAPGAPTPAATPSKGATAPPASAPAPAPAQPAAVITNAAADSMHADSMRAEADRKGRETDVQRETFAYGGGSRDPFASLINLKSAGPELADLQLVGIYEDMRDNANSVAVLREKTTGKRHKLRAGEQIGRLKVAQIRPKDIVFTVEDFGFERQETLSLRKQEDVTP